jgi:PKD repeat protein
VRKVFHLLLFVVLLTAGLNLTSTAAQAADTGNATPQTGKIVSDEPGTNAPNILDGTVYSVAKVGNMIVVGGQFSQVQNYNTSTTLTRVGVLAFDATTGKISTTFAPDALGIVYKVLPAADGTSVYVAGSFNSAAGQSMPGRLFKINVFTGVVDPTFTAPTISGDIRDLELVGNHLFVSGKFTHINGVSQKALGTVFADTGKRDPYMANVFAGLHNTKPGAVTNVLQISVNKQNTRLMAVGNFTTVDGFDRHQIVQLDISGASPVVSGWSTNLFKSACSANFETYMTDVEYSPNGQYFAVSTTGAYGGVSGSMAGTVGCDVVARFEGGSDVLSAATWTAYTGGDTTWTVEVTDNVIYAGGHQRWQNNPGAGDNVGQGAVSREGIAALNPANGMPYSWNPTRARGVGVQDMLATSEGLYVGSDTELIGHTAGNTYHARIAVLPLATGSTLPQLQTNTLPVDVYRVATAGSTLSKRNFTGTAVGTATNVATGPGWSTSTGAFMVNGVLYKTNTDGSLSRMTFNGTAYGTASAVNTADALVAQSDWHTDAKTITSLFYAEGRIYYTKSGVNALYRRGFEVESGVVGQQRFSTTTTGINWSNVRGAFVAGGKLYFANTNNQLSSATWDQTVHAPVAGTTVLLSGAGTGWTSRAMFPHQAVPAPLNEAPLAAVTISCDQLACTFDGTGSTDPENDPLTYDWNFGDGSAHGTTATATHTYADAGDRPVTLTVTDNKGATSSATKTASPTAQPDNISFVASSSTNGSRTNHNVPVPAGTKAGDTLLLFFSSNSTGPVYTGPAGWQQVLSENGSSFTGRLYSKTATAADLGSTVTITSRKADATTYYVKSDTTLAAYRGLGSPALKATAITSQNVSGAVHQTPVVSSPDGTSWLVSYWTDKSSGTTDWTGPATQTKRSLGTATGTNYMSSLLMDSDGRVNSGAQGGLNATANTSAQGLTMSVLLSGGTPPPVNQDPVAHASLVGCTDLTCSFDGESSTDGDGDTLAYDWNWGDGSAHGTTATASHTFGSGGNKTVTLTVTDPSGGTGADTVMASPVAPPVNAAPTAHITNTSCTNLVCSFDGSTSTDPDPDTLTYSWDFGDSSPAVTTANPTHTYSTPGQKTVTLTVDDGNTHTDTDSTTFTVTAPPPDNAAPTAHITNVSCTDLGCSFSGATSSDPDLDALSYNWDFGDSSTDATTQDASHTYATAGLKTVTLTVDDAHGHTATDTTTVNPTDPVGDPASNVVYVGSASTAGNRMTHAVTLPAGVNVGDTMVLFFGAASIVPTYTGPAGWTLVETKDGSSSMVGRAWTKTATAADTVANAKVTVTSSATAKSDLTVAVYRGTDGTTPIASSASKIDNAAGAAHTSPAVNATGDTDWLLTYWADRSNATTGWTAPAGPTVRRAGLPSDAGSAHVTALFVDSNGPVAPGAQGELTATANGDSSRGASFSILLKSS